jgi:hypothetical protein
MVRVESRVMVATPRLRVCSNVGERATSGVGVSLRTSHTLTTLSNAQADAKRWSWCRNATVVMPCPDATVGATAAAPAAPTLPVRRRPATGGAMKLTAGPDAGSAIGKPVATANPVSVSRTSSSAAASSSPSESSSSFVTARRRRATVEAGRLGAGGATWGVLTGGGVTKATVATAAAPLRLWLATGVVAGALARSRAA